MPNVSATKPVFLGGTLAEHVLFVVSLNRFQHHSLPLALVHYLTWSIAHVGMHSVAFCMFGVPGPIVLGVAISLWAMRMDLAVGSFLALLQVGYACAAIALRMPAGIALGSIVGAILLEVMSHVLIQGHPPRPPSAAASLSKSHKAVFVPYFVVVFGPFFLTLDLAMRVLHYRSDLHRRTDEVASQWHAEAARS